MLDQGTIQQVLNEGIKFEHTIETQSLIKLSLAGILVFLVIKALNKL